MGKTGIHKYEKWNVESVVNIAWLKDAVKVCAASVPSNTKQVKVRYSDPCCRKLVMSSIQIPSVINRIVF